MERDRAGGPLPADPPHSAASLAGPAGRAPDAAPDLLVAAERLRAVVEDLRLPLRLPHVERAAQEQETLLGQLEDYLLPRLRRMDAPLLAVVGGSTGAGKSTLVNSLVGHEVSAPGVLRPTTRAPVLVHHPVDSGAFMSQRILPGMARATGHAPSSEATAAPSVNVLRLVPAEQLTPGLALVDAPDIDSVVEANRDLAAQLLAAADLWLFVTTAVRYADAVPWDLLRQAAERGTSVAVVLNRVPAVSMAEVRRDLATMLRDRGLAGAPLFTLPETPLVSGALPDPLVAPLRGWLQRLAGDARARAVVVNRTLSGALDSLPARVEVLTAAAQDQAAAERVLRTSLDAVYAQARADIAVKLSDGSLLRGEVLTRWQEFVGTGELLKALENRVSRVRDRLTGLLRGRQPPVQPLEDALQVSVAAMVRAQAADAVAQTVLSWRAHPAGAVLVERDPERLRLSADFDRRLARALREWQGYVLELVGQEGAGKRVAARAISLGVNASGVVLMLVAFAHTGGMLGGAEIGVAAGTAAVAQRLLEAVFGDQAVRTLASKARIDLLARVDTLLDAERGRASAVLGAAQVQPQATQELRDAVAALRAAR